MTRLRVGLAALVLTIGGCGRAGFHPAVGTVVRPDGTPWAELEGFNVVFEGTAPDGRAYSATGVIGPDGTFEMGTDRPGDGAPAGTCKVLIEPKMRTPEVEEPYPIDPRYRTFDTSGLTAEVGPAGGRLTLTLDPAPAKRKR